MTEVNKPSPKKDFALAVLSLALVASLAVIFSMKNDSIPLIKSSDTKNNILFTSGKRPESFTGLPITQSTTCNFDGTMEVKYEDKSDEDTTPGKQQGDNAKIYFDYAPQEKPTSITFIDLDTKNPKIKSNNGQGDLVKLIDNDDTVTLVESGPVAFGTLPTYTIFKKEGVAIWSKQQKLLFTLPMGYISMGYCD